MVVEPTSRPRFFVGAAVELAGRLCVGLAIGGAVSLVIGGAVSTGANVAVGFFGLSLW